MPCCEIIRAFSRAARRGAASRCWLSDSLRSPARRGWASVLIDAKEFDGALRHALRSEVALLNTGTPEALFGASRRLGVPILLVIDGYNECTEGLRERLTRAVAAFAARYSATIFLTSQIALAREGLLALREVEVSYPSEERKLELCMLGGRHFEADAIQDLLASTSSALEAVLAGQVADRVEPGASKFAMFDAYARLRLGKHAYEGIRCLCVVASALIERASFRILVREYDRLAESGNFDSELISALNAARLLTQRGDHISFAHELFFAAFAAESAVRKANGAMEPLLRALKSPRYLASKSFILGAVEDRQLVRALLLACNDSSLYAASWRGGHFIP